MTEEFELRERYQVEPSEIYFAWLDSKLHSDMTGGEAVCSDKIGAAFSAWDGYISGKNISLVKNQKIVQSWRTTEFRDADEDSLLSIELIKIPEGTEIILTHTNIPKGQLQYKKGWINHYFNPMKEFFRK